MSILGDRLSEASVADLFAGSGALGLEALSRGARNVTFVERSYRALRVLERNVNVLEAGSAATVVRGDVFRHLKRLGAEHYDLALADPPYHHGYGVRLLTAYRRTRFARELWIEHDVREALPRDAVAEQRRYGDTALTRVRAGREQGHRRIHGPPSTGDDA